MSRVDRRLLLGVVPAGVVLTAMLAVGFEWRSASGLNEEYLGRVAETIAQIPYRIGPWIGSDMEVQEPAVRLLRPNKLLQRRYVMSDGTGSFSLLFVHCSDARDMAGHYPPVCYPAHGWVMQSSTPVEFWMGRDRVPGVVYTMSLRRQGEETRMTILNFFAVPALEMALAPDMDAVNRAAAASARSTLGAAQVQVLVPREATAPELVELFERIAPAVGPAVRGVIEGVGADAP
jgi:hypothetical protein